MTEGDARDEVAARVSRETFDLLEIYYRLLVRWQKTVNLISPTTVDAIWGRHILDSLQLLDHLDFDRGRWVDLGSGGGFPALVCAIGHDAKSEETEFHLIESDTRKCAFLRQVAQDTGIAVHIRNVRAETIPSLEANVVTARALAPLPRLLPLVHRHMAQGGTALLQKGARHVEELEQARRDWQMDVETLPSVTASDAVILRVRNLNHA